MCSCIFQKENGASPTSYVGLVYRDNGESMKVYLAGPMRGYRDYNFPRFESTAANLRDMGHTVFSPHENDLEKGYATRTEFGYDFKPAEEIMRDCIMDDLSYIAHEAEAVALMPGWKKSSGVAVELALAKFLGLKILELSENDTIRRSA